MHCNAAETCLEGAAPGQLLQGHFKCVIAAMGEHPRLPTLIELQKATEITDLAAYGAEGVLEAGAVATHGFCRYAQHSTGACDRMAHLMTMTAIAGGKVARKVFKDVRKARWRLR